jgi:transglutaminase-like putative cysteine protease
LRHFGLAARFVSGYIVQLADIKSLDGPSGPEKILLIYMLVEVYLPGAGWIGLDPTSGLCKRSTFHYVAHHIMKVQRL